MSGCVIQTFYKIIVFKVIHSVSVSVSGAKSRARPYWRADSTEEPCLLAVVGLTVSVWRAERRDVVREEE